jgi:hypothetical protein
MTYTDEQTQHMHGRASGHHESLKDDEGPQQARILHIRPYLPLRREVYWDMNRFILCRKQVASALFTRSGSVVFELV